MPGSSPGPVKVPGVFLPVDIGEATLPAMKPTRLFQIKSCTAGSTSPQKQYERFIDNS